MQDVKEFFYNSGFTFKENVSFKVLTTYKTGGNAKFVVFPKNIDELKKILLFLNGNNINFKVFGNGSNILASDNDYNGVIIKLTEMKNEIFDNNILTVDAGCSMMQIAIKYSKLGYSGLEFACGIPGTIGGVVFMNAGAYLNCISDILIDITYLDDNYNVCVIKKEAALYSYRNSIFKRKNWIILSARMTLTKGDISEIMSILDDRKIRRTSSQPLEYCSAGSVFRNPKDMYAGALIESCGLKGLEKGNAEISSKHANFIVNKGNSSSSDIKYLMDLAEKKVKEKYGVDLKREQELFNWE